MVAKNKIKKVVKSKKIVVKKKVSKVVKKPVLKKIKKKVVKLKNKKVKKNIVKNKVKTARESLNLPKITVIGVGGSGNNAINYMIKKDVKNVKFIAVNTDLQDLQQSKATKKIKIGQNITNGIGAGMNPEVGRKAAIEASDELSTALKDTQMLFVTGGMGGGTGTGASPIISAIAKDMGILTVAVVTRPFTFEGKKRMELADEGINELAKAVDSYIVIENNKILETTGDDATLEESFALSDEVLKQAVEGISELITKPGIINIDYADIKAVLEDSSLSLIGIGSAKGADRAVKAAQAAINSPLINISTNGAGSILFSIASSGDLKMSEISEIAEHITEEASADAMIKFGTSKNTKLKKDELKITVVASNFENIDKPSASIKSFGLTIDDNNFLNEEKKIEIDFEEGNKEIAKDESKNNDSVMGAMKSFFK